MSEDRFDREDNNDVFANNENAVCFANDVALRAIENIVY